MSSKDPFPLKKNFHGQKIFQKHHCLIKVDNFQLKNFFRRKICVGQSHFTQFSFCGRFSSVEMGLEA